MLPLLEVLKQVQNDYLKENLITAISAALAFGKGGRAGQSLVVIPAISSAVAFGEGGRAGISTC